MQLLIRNIFSLSAIFALATALGGDKRFERAYRLLFSLIFCSVLFSYLVTFLSADPPTLDVPQYEAGESSSFAHIVEQATARGLTLSICNEFSLDEEDIILSLSDFDSETHLPSGVELTLRGRGVLVDVRAVEEYLKEGGYTNVRVILSLDA